MAIELTLALILVRANGFFVATEFALEDVLEECGGEMEDEFDVQAAGSGVEHRRQ